MKIEFYFFFERIQMYVFKIQMYFYEIFTLLKK